MFPFGNMTCFITYNVSPVALFLQSRLMASPFLIHFWSYERENIMSLARLTVKDTVRSSIKVHLALISSFLYLLHVPLVHHDFSFSCVLGICESSMPCSFGSNHVFAPRKKVLCSPNLFQAMVWGRYPELHLPLVWGWAKFDNKKTKKKDFRCEEWAGCGRSSIVLVGFWAKFLVAFGWTRLEVHLLRSSSAFPSETCPAGRKRGFSAPHAECLCSCCSLTTKNPPWSPSLWPGSTGCRFKTPPKVFIYFWMVAQYNNDNQSIYIYIMCIYMAYKCAHTRS